MPMSYCLSIMSCRLMSSIFFLATSSMSKIRFWITLTFQAILSTKCERFQCFVGFTPSLFSVIMPLMYFVNTLNPYNNPTVHVEFCVFVIMSSNALYDITRLRKKNSSFSYSFASLVTYFIFTSNLFFILTPSSMG